eukprot:TRINITY_DN16641_c0_g1_i10.p1 TRINITY_DN16641_c0_g1~~TRINITY_DN16641_c0_g1_i10.p1  ORF type:complete len:146 (+),score=24.95 TRINITY_DN16641_c0_g1_i10:1-438(+)
MFVYSYKEKKSWALPWETSFPFDNFLTLYRQKTSHKDYGCHFRFFKEWFKSAPSSRLVWPKKIFGVVASIQAAKKVSRHLNIASGRFNAQSGEEMKKELERWINKLVDNLSRLQKWSMSKFFFKFFASCSPRAVLILRGEHGRKI